MGLRQDLDGMRVGDEIVLGIRLVRECAGGRGLVVAARIDKVSASGKAFVSKDDGRQHTTYRLV